MGKVKLCYFCELWESGGIESFINSVIKNLDMDAFSVDVVAAKIGESVFTAPLEDLGVTFYHLSGRLRNPKNYTLFKKRLREAQYDVVHFNIFQAYAFRYVKLAEAAGVTTRIVHAHGAGLRKSKTRRLKYVLHLLGRSLWKKHITHTLACSSVAAKFLFGKDADEIIKNGINTQAFAFSQTARDKYREKLGVGDSPVVGCVGRLSSEKNQGYLLEVFAKVLKKIPQARLLIVGDGPDGEMLKTKADKLEISDAVIFYGASGDIPGLMSAMDTFVFPSLFEGLGIVALEAQASGLPTICSSAVPSDVGITELVKFESLDAGYDKWADKIIELLDSPRERVSRAGDVKRAGFDVKESPKAVFKYYTTTL